MHIDFTVRRDDAYLRRMVRDAALETTMFWVYATAAPLLIAIMCFASGGAAWLPGVLSVALAICIAIYPVLAIRRETAVIPAYQRGPYHVTLDDRATTIETTATLNRFTWDTVTRVVEWPYAYLVWHGRMFRDLPRSGLTPEQDAELRRLLIGRRLLRNPSGSRVRSDAIAP